MPVPPILPITLPESERSSDASRAEVIVASAFPTYEISADGPVSHAYPIDGGACYLVRSVDGPNYADPSYDPCAEVVIGQEKGSEGRYQVRVNLYTRERNNADAQGIPVYHSAILRFFADHTSAVKAGIAVAHQCITRELCRNADGSFDPPRSPV